MKARLLSALIMVVVATATAIILFAEGASSGNGPMRSVFFAFVSAIIATQLIPAVMLLSDLIKSVFFNSEKKQEN